MTKQAVLKNASGSLRFALTAGRRMRVGRDPGNDISIDSNALGRTQAFVEIVEGDVWIEDAKGPTSTYVNGEAIHQRVRLASGDRIGFGGVELFLEVTE